MKNLLNDDPKIAALIEKEAVRIETTIDLVASETQEKYAEEVDGAVFPGTQGTTAVSNIAGKATIAKLALEECFVHIQQQTIAHAKLLAKELAAKGYRIVGGGTDTHQVVVDVTSKGIGGAQAENTLEAIGIITNRNYIPKDTGKKASGLRLGTGPIAVRGMGAEQVVRIGEILDAALMNADDEGLLASLRAKVLKICEAFPVYR